MRDEETIFSQALRAGPPAERAAFLDRACAADTDLRREVEALLAAHDQATGFLQSPPVSPPRTLSTGDETAAGGAGDAPRPPSSEQAGSVVGPYKLLEQIGEGGMGIVFMAEQFRPVRRRVALKIIKPGMDTRQVIARFDAERQALALMDHPNIAKVLEAGATDAGRPYFVMELVRGVPITDYCDQQKLSPRQRLELFVQVCQAVQHAHQKGIIHRDLKPTNVLVTLQDGRPTPKVIDFGVAKATAGQRLTDQTLFTEFRQLVGTPLYMSPEQAEMSALMDMDTRSDVYSLGVLLYELLTGTTPFDKHRLARAAYDEVRRIIREEEPPRPSTRLSTLGQTLATVSQHRHTDGKRLGQLVRGELDWIVMRCLEKDRARRYDTASGLAQDVERYLSDQPVEACPPSRLYRLGKFARRNRAALGTAGTLLGVLALATSVSTWEAVRATRAEASALAGEHRADEQAGLAQREAARADVERGRAVREAAKQEAVNRFLNDMLSRASPWGPTTGPAAAARVKGESVTVLEVVKEAVRKLDAGSMNDHPEIEAKLRMTVADIYWALGAGDEIAQAQTGVRLNQQVYGADSPEAAGSMAQLADFFIMRKRGAEAATILRAVVAAEQKRGKARFETQSLLADALRIDGKLAEADRLYREASSTRRPGEAGGFPWVPAEILWDAGRLAEAETLYRSILASTRSDPERNDRTLEFVLGQLAALLQQEGKLGEADDVRREKAALVVQRLQTELAASATPATSARIKLEMVQPLVFLGRTGEAEVTARQGMEAAGPAGLAGMVNDQAWSLAMNRKLMRRSDGPAVARLAAELAARAVELDAKNPLALNTLGVACYRTGDFTSCVNYLEKSLAAGAEVGRNYFFLAMAQQQLGNRDAAAAWWDKGMKRVDQNRGDQELLRIREEAAEVLQQPARPIPPASTPR